MDYLIDLKKQDLSGKTALEGGISLGVDTDGNIKKIDESGAISDIGGSIDESRLLPETGSVSSDSVGNPVIFKAISRIDNTYWLCLPLNEDTNDRSTYDVATGVYGTVNIVSNAPSSPGGSAFFNGSSCLHGTLPAQFGTSDFTVRLWMMAPAISSGSSSHTIFSTRRGNQTDASTFALLSTTEGRLFIYSNGDSTSRTDTPFTLQPSVWYHVAVVRKSGVLTIYVNGEVYNSATFTNSLTRQIFGLGASWTGSSYSEAGTVYLTSLDVLNYAAYDGAFTTPAYQPGILAGAGYEVATDSELKDMLSAAGIDESRLLPALDSVPVDRSGNPVVFKAVSGGMDEHTLLYCPFDADFNDHSSYARTVTHDTSRAGLSISLERNKFGTGSLQGTGYTPAGAVYVQMPTPIGAADFTIHKWIYVTSAADRFGIFSTYGEAGSGTGPSGYGVDGLACWIDTDGTLKLYKASAHFSSYWYDDDSGNKLAEAAMPSDYLNRWVHIAVARSGNIWMLFADGSLLNSNSKEFNAVQPYLRIGSADSKATAYGNIDEFIVLDYAKWITDFEPPTQPASEVTKSYEVSDKGAGTVDESRLLPENPANGDIPCFDATATIGGGNDAHTKILLHFDADEIKDEAAGNAAPVTITKKTGTITVVEGGKWGKCAKYVTGSMTVATNLDELNANNWVVSGWFNPDENNHGVSYPTWLSMDDSSTNGFGFDSTGRYGESDGPLFYMDTPPASGTWHWLAIVKYSGGLRFYLNGAFLNEISAQQRANFCSTLAIGGFAGTHAAGSTERTFSGLVDEVRLQYIPDDEITQWTGTSIAVPDAPYSKPQTVGKWGKFNKSALVKSVSGQLPDNSGAVTIPAATASAAGLMAAADKAAIAGLTTHGIYPNASAKSGAIDFNEVIDHGFYFIGGDTPHLNYPETYQQNGGTLQVIRNGNYLTQTLILFDKNKSFNRSCFNATSGSSERTFSAWQRLLTDTEITESKARPGYFKLPGGMIVQWGAVLNITADGTTSATLPIAFPNSAFVATATTSGSGLIASVVFDGNSKLDVIVKGHPGSGSFAAYWIAIGY
jgi:hypothetical protein|nr:MAG TPA: head to tail adaptor [Caudoviricetes sp.]